MRRAHDSSNWHVSSESVSTILKVELEDTRREADLDPLTKLWNRGVFQRELPRAVQVRTLVDEPACLAMIDIDHFKQTQRRARAYDRR